MAGRKQVGVRIGRRSFVSMVVCVVSLAGSASAGAAAAGTGSFAFTPPAQSATCVNGGPTSAPPIALPDGFSARVVAEEGAAFPDQADMNTLNETGPQAGRYLYRTHEVRSSGALSRTDLETGVTELVHMEPHWERLDGIEWTPWHTLLIAEEIRATRAAPRLLDPNVPQALAGLVYEIDPADPTHPVARPAIGSRAHEGLAFDAQGNLYGIAEVAAGGAIFKFSPDRRGDLSSGQVYALRVVSGAADKTGEAQWIPLDDTASIIDSEAAANAAGATNWLKPEDIEVWAETLYVAISDEHRVIAIDLRHDTDADGNQTAFVWDYVKAGVNAPAATPQLTSVSSFFGPDNLAFDAQGYLYMAEDVGGRAPNKTRGNDVWMASPPRGERGMAESTVRFLSLTDCLAEPSGIHFDRGGRTLYVNVMHRGGSAATDLNLPDLSIAITQG